MGCDKFENVLFSRPLWPTFFFFSPLKRNESFYYQTSNTHLNNLEKGKCKKNFKKPYLDPPPKINHKFWYILFESFL